MRRKREVYWHEDTAPIRYAREHKTGVVRGVARWLRDIFAGLMIVVVGMFEVVLIMMAAHSALKVCYGGSEWWVSFFAATLLVVALAMRPGHSVVGKLKYMAAICGCTFALVFIIFAVSGFTYPNYC